MTADVGVARRSRQSGASDLRRTASSAAKGPDPLRRTSRRVRRAAAGSARHCGRFVRLAASAILIVPLLGCATEPTPEFRAYQAAFEEGGQAAAAIVAAYEPLEIQQQAVTARNRADFDAVYDPDEARWFAPAGRGLVSKQIEQGFDAIETYNSVLALYATGESFSLIEPRLQALATETAALASFAGIPGLNQVAGTALVTALGAISAAADRTQFQEAVRANSDAVLAFLDELRATTPVLWSNAINAFRQREIDALRSGDDFDRDAARAQFRSALDAWVMSLESMREATEALQAAVISGARTITLEELAAFAAQVRTRSEEARLAARAVARAF